MKVSVIGAGNVGASCAEYIAIKKIASEVVILDIKKGLAEGKALDLTQTSSTLGFDTIIRPAWTLRNSPPNCQLVIS